MGEPDRGWKDSDPDPRTERFAGRLRRGEPFAPSYLERLAIEGRQKAWWSAYRDVVGENYSVYIGLEDSAERIFEYQERAVPGLLQTEAYMRALFFVSYGPISKWAVGAEKAEQLIRVRLARQGILRRASRPRLSAVIDESVVRRVVGDVSVHRDQLSALLASFDSMDIRVFPFRSSGGSVVIPSFVVLGAPGGGNVAYEEHLSRSALYDGRSALPYVQMADWLKSHALSSRHSERLISKVIDELGAWET